MANVYGGDSASASDVGANNPGADPLGFGMVDIARDQNGRVYIALEGAAVSGAYDVTFERFNDHNREDLGTITTDAQGNFRGPTPSGLTGTNRVGTFVLTRGGEDMFVSVLG